ncbi:aldose epimerase family protein [Salisediminibacterium beveridgei]|uniref:Aldose 1-epimerase n=1 Tax=Salisediminibacterium beveridgei TaxID=632773 RepID=A0A1D7QXK5_9BACI|nr:aldose epimerase family protein [Salisediminibacterium beveridgei]AOM83743.1 Aldose 1-epimerase [Salisediminibacterium beveridgei]
MNETNQAVMIENSTGTMKLRVIPTGAAVTDLWFTSESGEQRNLVVSYEEDAEYQSNPYFLGAAIGRSAGRQGEGRVKMPGGKVLNLPANEGRHHLHGGDATIAKKDWELRQTANNKVVCTVISPDGDGGYPGDVRISVTYEVTDEAEWKISYLAEASEDTPLNLTQHTYFNLSGEKKEVTEHQLTLDSDRVLFLEPEDIPGSPVTVDQEPDFDFRQGKSLSFLPAAGHPQLVQVGGGVDHPFLLNKSRKPDILLEGHGLQMAVDTDDEAVVIYTGNKFDGERYLKYQGICVETQFRPNALDQCILKAGDAFSKTTIFRFSSKSTI